MPAAPHSQLVTKAVCFLHHAASVSLPHDKIHIIVLNDQLGLLTCQQVHQLITHF